MNWNGWNQKCRSGHCVSLIILLGLLFTGAAWINTIPSTCRDCRHHRIRSATSSFPIILNGKREEKEDSRPEEGKIFGYFSRFSSGESSKEKGDEAKKGEEDSTGLFRSISRRFESRKETREAKNKARKEAKLADILDKERRKDGIASYVPRFNGTGVASALRDMSSGLTQAKEEIRNIRTDKAVLSEEEKRLEELRKRTLADKRRRIIAQQLADQRSMERRQKKELEDLEAKQAKETKDVENKKGESASSQDSNAQARRSNPLSVAQKYVSSFFETPKDQEEWLVVAPKTRISPGEMVPVTAAGLDLLLVASKDGSALYCIANSCPHLGTPLEVGMLERRPIEASIPPDATTTSPFDASRLQETDITNLLTQDGCEDCIVCPLHRTAFALGSGEVRGEWCPYPPVIGKVMGAVKSKSSLPVFDVRTKGKNIEVRLNTPLNVDNNED